MGILGGSDIERIKNEALYNISSAISSLTTTVTNIYNLVKSNNTILYGGISSILNNISSNTTNTNVKINDLSTKIGIKSVQRGIFSFGTSGMTTISISSVNTSKCFVLINDAATGSNEWNTGCYLHSITSTSIRIDTYLASRGGYGSWQVIEFN